MNDHLPGAIVPFIPYPRPVEIPASAPGDSPTVCLQINVEWLPYLLGCAKALTVDSTWASEDVAIVQSATSRANDLLDILCSDGACLTVEYRLDPGNACIIEARVDAASPWVTFYDPTPCFPTAVITSPSTGGRNLITTQPGVAALQTKTPDGSIGASINEFGESTIKVANSLPFPDATHWGSVIGLTGQGDDQYFICRKMASGSFAWIAIAPPYVPPSPPDLTHYLVDDPGALNQRDNNLTPAAGHFGLAITANGQPGVAVVQPSDHPAIDLFSSVATNIAPVLRLSTATNSPSGGFIHLGNQHGDAEPITPEFAWRTPPVYTLPPADAAHFGAIMLNGDVAIICVLNYTTGVYSWQPVGGGGIQAIHTAYTPLLEGDTPNLQLIANATDATITMKLPPIPPALHVHTAYTPLLEGDTPNLQLIATPTDATITMKLPPIPPALHIHTAVETLNAGAAPQLQLIATPTDATITMKLPPIPSAGSGNCPDTALPAATKTKAYQLSVDATGTAIPMKIPAGYTLADFSVSGVWLNVQAGTPEFIKYTSGQHNAAAAFPQYGDLILRVTTGTPTTDGIWTTPATGHNPFTGFTATEDCYAWLEQYYVVEAGGGGAQGNYGAGQLCVAYTITAGLGYDWAVKVRLDQSGYHFTGLNANGGQPAGFIPGKGISSGPGGWILGCHIGFTWPNAPCTIRYAQMHAACAVPQSGGTAYLYKGGEFVMLQDFTNPLSTGDVLYSRSDLSVPITHDDYIDCSVTGNDQPGNSQEVWFVDFTLAGDGTAPTFTP